MGKRRFNTKARQNVEAIIDETQSKKIKIDLGEDVDYGGYDQANALVLPSQKRTTKIKTKSQQVTRILSKKQRKRLEKIVDRKKKKEGRAELLENLASVQIPQDELKQYTSISTVQTIGTKNFHKLVEINDIIKPNKKHVGPQKTSSIAGLSRKRRLALLSHYNDAESSDDENDKIKERNLNIIGTELESSDDTASEDEAKEETQMIEGGHTQCGSLNIINNGAIFDETEAHDQESHATVKQPTPPTEVRLTKTPPAKTEYKPAIYVHVNRDPAIQAARYKLPILAEEQQIMETISENSIVIIAGETGSGKTTQIPQFLYEAGYAQNKLIGITEPRRVAAISMSRRVAEEMNLSDREVSYLIRFEGNVTEDTRIKFMTDGVLLKEIETDFLLSRYSVIILDEAHERSVYTDILVGLLSRIVPLRHKKGNPLKLIIMSATLRVEDFTGNNKLFKTPPPVLKVETRQHPVTIHFQKNTNQDYVKEAFRKAVKIHSKLPDGGILLFVTGQQEVNYLVRKLRRAFPCKDKSNSAPAKNTKSKVEINSRDNDDSDDDEFDMKRAIKCVKKSKKKLASQVLLPKINLDNYKLPTEDTDADLLENDLAETDQESESDDPDLVTAAGERTKQPLWVLPLYSLLSSEKQKRVFDPPPQGCRLCVVSTNVAETSLTIPNIKYVVDTGRQKTRLYDKVTGVSAFVVTFTSKASAEQRAGRAGRVSAGHCYRLYSSAVFNDEFEAFAVPDIQKKPVDDLMLQMKCMGIDKVVNFPFPSPPNIAQLEVAEKRLKLLGALEDCPIRKGNNETITKVTPLGYAISAFPVAPRFGKMLALSHQQNLLAYTVCMVAALSVQEVLLEVSLDNEKDGRLQSSKWATKRRVWAGSGNYQLLGDPMVLLRSVGAAEYAGSQGKLNEFCEENGLRMKAISEIRKLRVQLTNEINLNIPDLNLSVDPKMQPPTDLQAKFLRQILLSGMGDQVARKIPDDELKDKETRRKFKYAYQCSEMEDPVFMHSSSVLKKKQPEWVVYQEIYQLENGDTQKMFMRGITAIEPEWLLKYAPKMCNIRAVKDDPPPTYNAKDGKVYCFVDASFGRSGWNLPLTEVEMPLSENACKYFGMFLLNGDVFPKLLEFKSKLKSSPKSIIKSWAKLNAFVSNFSKALVKRHINSREKLNEIWKTEPTYLLMEYSELLYDVDTSELSLIWPPID